MPLHTSTISIIWPREKCPVPSIAIRMKVNHVFLGEICSEPCFDQLQILGFNLSQLWQWLCSYILAPPQQHVTSLAPLGWPRVQDQYICISSSSITILRFILSIFSGGHATGPTIVTHIHQINDNPWQSSDAKTWKLNSQFHNLMTSRPTYRRYFHVVVIFKCPFPGLSSHS